MIGTLESVIIDCPDPAALAGFYAELLGVPIFVSEDDWAEIPTTRTGRPLIAFQKVDGQYTPPQWPGQIVPQQFHLDIKVDDIDAAEPTVLELGATATGSGGETYRVYLDPAGHPFCLISPND